MIPVIGKDYNYNQIETFAKDNNWEFDEYGEFIIGRHFIAVGNEDIIYSFILTGYNNVNGGIYTLIYAS